MGCRILSDRSGMSCFYDSVTDTAFGPVFPSAEVAEKFLSEECGGDARGIRIAELHDRYREFADRWVCECDTLRDDDEPEPTSGVRFQCQWCKRKEKLAMIRKANARAKRIRG